MTECGINHLSFICFQHVSDLSALNKALLIVSESTGVQPYSIVFKSVLLYVTHFRPILDVSW